jgi:hypothetical protein
MLTVSIKKHLVGKGKRKDETMNLDMELGREKAAVADSWEWVARLLISYNWKEVENLLMF